MSRPSVRNLLRCLFLAGPLLIAGSAQANVGRDYGESVQALNSRNWALAEEKILDALATSDRALESIEIAGGIRYRYMPYYVLGAARFGRGDCAGAMAAWQRSLAEGQVQQSQREYTALRNGLAECEAAGAQPALAVVPPQQETVDAAGAADGAPPKPQDDTQETQRREALAEQRRLAEERNRELARQRELAEQRRQEQLREQRAGAARDELRGVLDDVAAMLNDTDGDEPVRAARAGLAAASNAAAPLLQSDSPDAINRELQALRDAGRVYDRALQEWTAEQREIAYRTPPAALKQLAERYFAGEYATVVAAADPGAFDDQRQRIQAFLFRSAAAFKQYWLGGGEEARLLEQAARDIEEIKRINARFRPYVAAFPPKYIEFFDAR